MKKENIMTKLKLVVLFFLLVFVGTSCSKDSPVKEEQQQEQEEEEEEEEEGPTSKVYTVDNIEDTYYDVAGVQNVRDWGPYNVHDPSVIKVGDTYYCYNTDVSFGSAVRPGIQ